MVRGIGRSDQVRTLSSSVKNNKNINETKYDSIIRPTYICPLALLGKRSELKKIFSVLTPAGSKEIG